MTLRISKFLHFSLASWGACSMTEDVRFCSGRRLVRRQCVFAVVLLQAVLGLESCRPRSGNSAVASNEATAGSDQGTATVFFHWGRGDANGSLLSATGYPAAAPHADQSIDQAGEHVEIRDGLIKLTRNWFEAGGRQDLAGPGLYLSNNPFDSMEYGPDLLVAVRTNPAGNVPPLQDIVSGVALKDRTTAAIARGADGDLPLMSYYTSTWAVAVRAPHAGDPFGLVIGPPRKEDAAAWWKWYTVQGALSPDQAVKSAKTLACQVPSAISQGRTASASSFFRTLFGGVVLDALAGLDFVRLTDDGFSDLNYLARGYAS